MKKTVKKTVKRYNNGGGTPSDSTSTNKYTFSASGKVIRDSKGNILNPNSPQGKEALDAVKATPEQRKAVGQQKNGGTMKMGGTKKKMMAAPKKKTAAKKK
jgi:hypothetical protein